MNKNIIFLLCLVMTYSSMAQNVGISNTNTSPDNSAILDINSTDKGLLIPRMDSTSRKSIVTPAEGLMVFDSTYNSFYFHNGATWRAIGGGVVLDDLGNHKATQNIQLNDNWLNHDGGVTEGININATGQVGVGQTATGNFGVKMSSGLTTNISQPTSDLGSSASYLWQSFTPTQSGELHSITFLSVTGNASVFYELYQGNGTGGTLIAPPGEQIDPSAPILFSGVQLTANQTYTIAITNLFSNFYGGTSGNPYGGGEAWPANSGFFINADFAFEVKLLQDKPGFIVSDTSVVVNDYALPILDGATGQVMATNGNGVLTWTDNDKQQLSLNANQLSISNGGTPVNLSGYADNTDAQQLSLSGNNLSLTNGGAPVDLSTYHQQLSYNSDTLSLTNGGDPIGLNEYNQELTLNSNSLSLTNGGTPTDLSGYIDNTDAQQLTLNSNSLSLTNGGTPIDLSGYLDNTDAQQLSASGNSISVTNGGPPIDLGIFEGNDNLGNHTATSNIHSNGKWLSSDGDDEGIYVDANGQVGIGRTPESTFHVQLKTATPFPHVHQPLSGFRAWEVTNYWQSFTPTESGPLEFITIDITAPGAITPTYTLYEGTGTGGTPLYTNSTTGTTFPFDSLPLTASQVYTIGLTVATSDTFHVAGDGAYLGGTSDIPGYDLKFSVYMIVDAPGFKVDNNGVTMNDYTFPLNDGSANQALTTDGAGNVSWTTQNLADNLGNHTTTQNLQLNQKWLSGDGENEGIYIYNNSTTWFKGNQYHFSFTATEDDAIIDLGDGEATAKWQIRTETNGMYGYNGDLVFKSKIGVNSADPLAEVMRINYLGDVGIGRVTVGQKLEVEGNASKSTAGAWLANSDARLKKNITSLSSTEMLEKMLSLKGTTYDWNDTQTGTQRPEETQYGFIAQNIQEVFPTLVKEDNNGFLQTAYGTYDAMTVEAIRALNNKIEKLENLSRRLADENARLKTQLPRVQQLELQLAKLESFLAEDKTAADKLKVNESKK